jgi:hypothetical protein
MADNYTVTSQRQRDAMVGNTFQPVQEITFTTTSGVTGSVLVPIAQYTADNVHKAIEARVKVIDEVNSL